MAKDVSTERVGSVRVEVEHKVGWFSTKESVLAVNEKTGKTAHVESSDRQFAIDAAVKKVR